VLIFGLIFKSFLIPLALIAAVQPAISQSDSVDDATRNPELAIWRSIKSQLAGPNAAKYFRAVLKDAQLPMLSGKIVKIDPAVKPTVIVLAMEDGVTPDATLRFETPLVGSMKSGAALSFEGTAESYTTEPFMVVFRVERDGLHGWTGRNTAPAPKKK
jgi:hypothetical protein